MKKLIHIVDDDASVRASLTELLTSVGWAVEAFPSGKAFLDNCPQNNKRLSCLILDMTMPGMNGAEVQEWLHKQGVTFPTVVLTADPHCNLAKQAMARGAHSVLAKPCNPQHLVATVATAMAP
jgi:two-component system, LuxR family, response regulator FixJ